MLNKKLEVRGRTMRTYQVLTSIVAGLVAGVAQLANAADLEVAHSRPVRTWSGCYAGIHLGAGALHDSYTGAVNPAVVNPAVGVPTANVQDQWGFGVLGGSQLGCDWQFGRLVVGIQSEMWGSTLRNESNLVTFGISQKASTTNPFSTDLTGRFGVALDEFLLYMKAGVAWGSFRYDFTSFGAAQRGSAFSTGFIWGVGLEYQILPKLTLLAETDVLFYGAKNVNIACTGCAGPNAFTASISAYELLFKVGSNYRFN
jgi:outer membrane immunogenic protein